MLVSMIDSILLLLRDDLDCPFPTTPLSIVDVSTRFLGNILSQCFAVPGGRNKYLGLSVDYFSDYKLMSLPINLEKCLIVSLCFHGFILFFYGQSMV